MMGISYKNVYENYRDDAEETIKELQATIVKMVDAIREYAFCTSCFIYGPNTKAKCRECGGSGMEPWAQELLKLEVVEDVLLEQQSPPYP